MKTKLSKKPNKLNGKWTFEPTKNINAHSNLEHEIFKQLVKDLKKHDK